MGVSFGTWCPRCLVTGPGVGDSGRVGTPTLKGEGSFGSIWRGLAAFKIVTPDIEAFAAFLEAHDGHGVKQWADVSYDPRSEDAAQIRASQPFAHEPGPFVQARLQLACSACGGVLISRSALLRPLEPFQPTPDAILRFRSRVLESDVHVYRAGFPFGDEREHLAAFLERHRRHVIDVRLLTEPKALPLGPPRRQWVPPDWSPEASERWLGPVPIEALQGLHERSVDRRREAVSSMRHREGMGYVVAALHDSDHTVRLAAASTLGRLGDGRAVRALGACLDDLAPDVRAAAQTALSALGATREEARREARTPRGPYGVLSWSVAPSSDEPATLERALRDPRPGVRLGAVERLVAVSESDAVGLLLLASADPVASMRFAAAKQLGRFGQEPRAIAGLLALVRDVSPIVVSRAVEAIAPLHVRDALPSLLDALMAGSGGYHSEGAIEAVGDSAACPVLRGALDHELPQVRATAAKLLASLGGEAELSRIVPVLQDPVRFVREAAIGALGKIGTSEAIKVLAGLRKSRANHDRSQAVAALVSIRNASAAEALTGFLAEKEFSIRSSAANGLIAFGSRQQAAAGRRALKAPLRSTRSSAKARR